ncbi:kinesin, putative [Trypanosoma cruzi]|nr:kinesin, putative [Trypanosoma cruzi]
MQSYSPAGSPLNSARPASTPRRRENDFRRVHSSRSITTTHHRSIVELSQGQGNAMRVYVRVRPFSERELSLSMPHHSTVRIDVENPCLITLLDPQKDFRPRETFSFTRCFWSVLEQGNNDMCRGRTAGEIRGSIDMFINNNASSARGNRSRCLNTSLSNTSVLSARGRAAAENSVSFEGAGSNAAIVAGSVVTHPPYSAQQDIYNEVGRPILENTLEGYNGCVFAYGQTGSGKTFSMFGYAPKSADFHSTFKHQHVAFEDYEEDDCEVSKPSISFASPARFSRASLLSSQNSLKDGFAPQLGTQGNTDRPAVDIVDHTGMDPNELQGIIPRISADLFSGLREKRDTDPSHSYRVEVEYYEIYNEKVYDLIRPQKDADLRIRHNPVSGPYVEGLTSKVVANEEEVARVIRKGSVERHTAATKVNDRSSRSHAIITLNIMQLILDKNDNTCKKQSKLNLVDLAGSERTGAVGAEGKQFLEGTKINLSLTTLGRVIDCLADLAQSKSLSVPVPYRDSNLTWLLMDSLGGNSKTSMLATISPHSVNFDEMRQTIRYASRARQIVNKAVINEDPQVRQIRLLTAELDRLKKVIRDAGHNEFSRDYVLELQRRNNFLEKRCQEQEMFIVELQAELEGRVMTNRTEDSRAISARRARPGHLPETSARQRRDAVEEEKNPTLLKSQLVEAKSENEVLRRQIAEEERNKRPDASNSAEQVAELNIRVQNLKREVDKMRKYDAKKEQYMQRYSFFYVDLASDILHRIMLQKEEEFVRQVAHLFISQNGEMGDGIRRLNKAHREEMEQMRKRHVEEMEELHKLSSARLKESIEKSNELYQQLIDKHVDKLNYVEERMMNNKEFYEAELKRLGEENEKTRVRYEEQLDRVRTQHQKETRKLREQLSSGASDRQRSGEVVKRLQEEHEKEMNRRQEEMDRYRQDKEQEISRLKKQVDNEKLRYESDMLEKERQRRSLEREVNELRRELLKAQTERNRMEQQHHTELQNLSQQQERLVHVSNGLLSDWDNRSSAMDASFTQLRALLQTQDYLNFRARLRDATLERKDYTAELEAVEERKRRDTQRLREIVQQLRQNQEDSKASIQRFEEDIMKHLARSNKARHSGNSSNKNSHENENGDGNSKAVKKNADGNSTSGTNKSPTSVPPARAEKKEPSVKARGGTSK